MGSTGRRRKRVEEKAKTDGETGAGKKMRESQRGDAESLARIEGSGPSVSSPRFFVQSTLRKRGAYIHS